jgi:hypothetical protein
VKGQSRAIHEIQCDAHKFSIRLTDASDSRDRVAVHPIAEQIAELAQRGLYHESLIKSRKTAQFAMRGYAGEPEAR